LDLREDKGRNIEEGRHVYLQREGRPGFDAEIALNVARGEAIAVGLLVLNHGVPGRYCDEP